MTSRAASLLLFGSLVGAPAFARGGQDVYTYVEPDGSIAYTNVKPSGKKNVTRMKRLKSSSPRGGAFKAAQRPMSMAPRAVRVTREEYDDFIRKAARRYRIPEALVWAVMHAESNFNPHAVSHAGAQGLMQLMPATAEEMYVEDVFDVRSNIEGGTRYLRVLANMFEGDMVKMVAAYNAGPDAVKKYGGNIPPYSETRQYVKKVIALYFDYKQRNPGADEELVPEDSAEFADRAESGAQMTGAD